MKSRPLPMKFSLLFLGFVGLLQAEFYSGLQFIFRKP